MNETIFQKIKIFLCGCGTAIVAFLFFLLRRRSDSVSHNTDTDDGTATDIDRISGTANDIRTTTERFAETNRKLADILAEIEKTKSEN